jgi:hypothetical protein
MTYQLESLDATIGADQLNNRIDRLLNFDAPRYRRLWAYYRNPMLPVTSDVASEGAERPYRQAQEWGLPPRVTGVVVRPGSSDVLDAQPTETARKEVVIENDIAWRVETMVDFLFGKGIVINSTAPDVARHGPIERLVRAVIEHNGGVTFLQQLALLGAVYGFVDVLVKFDPSKYSKTEPSPQASFGLPGQGVGAQAHDDEGENSPASDGAGPSAGPGDSCAGSHTPPAGSAPVPPCDAAAAQRCAAEATCCPRSPVDESPGSHPGARITSHDDALARIARTVRLEIVEPARALPVLCATDWRAVDAYVQVYRMPRESAERRASPRGAAKRGILHKLLERFAATRRGALFDANGSLHDDGDDHQVTVTEFLTAHQWQRYEDARLVGHGSNSLGELPLVHIQNAAVPFEYAGMSDVEPLIPLQDELNTRLSDRAHRITLQSFKMYLGKGIENFTSMPVAPGRMWMTDNEAAQVIEFGGDASAPSEDRHIEELREAMDKTSGVSPIAAGAIKGRIGRLTSAAALRVTMLALLARTERKRTTYGEGIARMCELALAWLDRAGLFATALDERRVAIHWPNPIPLNEVERLEEAKRKRELGVPEQTVLRELGY